MYLATCPVNGQPSCLICKKTFKQECNARRHIKNLHLENPVKCDLCFKVFSNSRYCNDHKRYSHNVRQRTAAKPSPDHIVIDEFKIENGMDEF